MLIEQNKWFFLIIFQFHAFNENSLTEYFYTVEYKHFGISPNIESNESLWKHTHYRKFN